MSVVVSGELVVGRGRSGLGCGRLAEAGRRRSVADPLARVKTGADLVPGPTFGCIAGVDGRTGGAGALALATGGGAGAKLALRCGCGLGAGAS